MLLDSGAAFDAGAGGAAVDGMLSIGRDDAGDFAGFDSIDPGLVAGVDAGAGGSGGGNGLGWDGDGEEDEEKREDRFGHGWGSEALSKTIG